MAELHWFPDYSANVLHRAAVARTPEDRPTVVRSSQWFPQRWLIETIGLSARQKGELMLAVCDAMGDGDMAFLKQFSFIGKIRVRRIGSKRTMYLAISLRRAVCERDKYQCRACGSTVGLEYDHVVPVVHGGGDSIDNIQLLCRPCNRAKGPQPWERQRMAMRG